MRVGWAMMAGALALAGVTAAAMAQQAPAVPQADPERQARARAMFERLDADKDGYVTRAEAQGAREQARARMETARKERRDRAFARLDANRDGNINRAEFDAAPRMAAMEEPRDRRTLRRMDRRGTGAMAGLPMFDRMDADKDGRVSLAEAQAAQPRRFVMRRIIRNGPGMPPQPLSDAERPLGGGRD